MGCSVGKFTAEVRAICMHLLAHKCLTPLIRLVAACQPIDRAYKCTVI